MPDIIDQITKLIGLVVLVQILPTITGALGALGALGGITGGIGGTTPPPPAPVGPSDFEQFIEREREISAFERDVRAEILGELRATREATEIFAPGLTREDVYSTPETTFLGIGTTPPVSQQPAPIDQGTGSIPGTTFLGIGTTPPVRQQAAPVEQGPPDTSGPYWVNPQTGGFLATFIPGETPQSVVQFRMEDIFPAIRNF